MFCFRIVALKNRYHLQLYLYLSVIAIWHQFQSGTDWPPFSSSKLLKKMIKKMVVDIALDQPALN